MTGAKSARNLVETKVGGVLKTSGKIWNVGVKYNYISLYIKEIIEAEVGEY